MRLPFSLRLALPSIHLSTFVENVFSYLFMYFFSTLKDVVLASLFQNPTKHISDQTRDMGGWVGLEPRHQSLLKLEG